MTKIRRPGSAVARSTFARLGAAPGVQEIDMLLERSRPAGLTEREVEVLRLVAEGGATPTSHVSWCSARKRSSDI